MSTVGTKEVFDLYFETIPEGTTKKIRSQVDRPEVYAYEKKLGKQIFDMDVDELFGMVKTFGNKRTKTQGEFAMSYASYSQIASTYRSIWNYYIENIRIIVNPWHNKRMRGTEAVKFLSKEKEAFTFQAVEDAIEQLYNAYEDGHYMPKYVECLVMLFYNGFAEAREIVELKENMINFKTHDVRLNGRTIHLSEHCFNLLEYVHNLDEVESGTRIFKAVPYHDGYFKFVVRRGDIDKIQHKTVEEAAAVLVGKISVYIGRPYNREINYKKLYFLGFYEYIVSKAGADRARELVLSTRNSADAQELLKYTREYGINMDNATLIKRDLRPYIQS